MRICPKCGSDDIGTAVMARSYDNIRQGAKRFDACRVCRYWEISVATRDTTKDSDDWLLVQAGQDVNPSHSERKQTDVARGQAGVGSGKRSRN